MALLSPTLSWPRIVANLVLPPIKITVDAPLLQKSVFPSSQNLFIEIETRYPRNRIEEKPIRKQSEMQRKTIEVHFVTAG